MKDELRHSVRASATAMGLAIAIMALATTQPQSLASPHLDLAALVIHGSADNPSGDAIVDLFDGELKQGASGGIVYANFLDGPVGLFGALQSDGSDMVSIRGGPDDAAMLTSLLDSASERPELEIGSPAVVKPYQVSSVFDSAANAYVLSVFTDSNMMNAQLARPSKDRDARPPIGQSGEVDCTGAVICRTDPTSNVTTVTYPDGIVAIVERVHDLTLVAYNTISTAVLGELEKLPPRGTSHPITTPDHVATLGQPTLADSTVSPAPDSTEDPANGPVADLEAPYLIAAAPANDPAAAPTGGELDEPLSEPHSGPLLNVVRPAPDYSPTKAELRETTSSNLRVLSRTLDEMASKVNSAVNGMTDAIDRMLHPTGSKDNGAADNADSGPTSSDQP